jgi:hypothetical protein
MDPVKQHQRIAGEPSLTTKERDAERTARARPDVDAALTDGRLTPAALTMALRRLCGAAGITIGDTAYAHETTTEAIGYRTVEVVNALRQAPGAEAVADELEALLVAVTFAAREARRA